MVTMFRFALDGCWMVPLQGHPKKSADSTRFSIGFKVEAGESLGRREPRRKTALERAEQALQPPALHALHHPLHLEELLHQPVDVLDLDPCAPSDPLAPGAIDDAGCPPLPGC